MAKQGLGRASAPAVQRSSRAQPANDNARAQRAKVPLAQVHDYLRRYQAEIHRDVSTEKAHVYYSRPMQKWIAVVRSGNDAILTFTEECPCSRVLDGKTPW